MPREKSAEGSAKSVEELLLDHLNGDVKSNRSSTDTLIRSIKLDIPLNIVDAMDDSATLTESSASNCNNSETDEELVPDNEMYTILPDTANGFYFDDRTPSPVKPKLVRCQSPIMKDPNQTLQNYAAKGFNGASHYMYSIDELSEGSGRSQLLMEHEYKRVEQVREILENQERHARMERPTSRRNVTLSQYQPRK